MEFIYALLAALAIGAIALLGILIIPKQWDHDIEQRLVGFAAGVLMAAATLQLLPEAVDSGPEMPVYFALLFGMLGFFILERFLHGFHTHQPSGQRSKAPGYLVLIGDGLQNLIDGVAIGVAFQVNPAIGAATAIAVAAHEVPQEIADYIVLTKSGFTRQKALLLNFASALTAVLGVVIAFLAGDFLGPYQGVALALTAGVFLYIAAADLIPELNHAHPTGSKYALPLLIGVALVAALTLATPHSHEEEPHAEDGHAAAVLLLDRNDHLT